MTTATTEPTESHLRAQLKLHFSAAIACGELADTDVAYIVDLAEKVASAHVAEQTAALRAENERLRGWEKLHGDALKLVCDHIENEKKLTDENVRLNGIADMHMKEKARADALAAQVRLPHKSLSDVMACLPEAFTRMRRPPSPP